MNKDVHILQEAYQQIQESQKARKSPDNEIKILFGLVIPQVLADMGIEVDSFTPRVINNGAAFIYNVTNSPETDKEFLDYLTNNIYFVMEQIFSQRNFDISMKNFKLVIKQNPFQLIFIIMNPSKS